MLITMLVKTGEKRILVLSVEVQMLSTVKTVGHFYTGLGNNFCFSWGVPLFNYWRTEIMSPTGFSTGAEKPLVQLLVNFFSV